MRRHDPGALGACSSRLARGRDYVTPRYIELDVGRDCCQAKLVANLYHGHCLVLHLVHAHIAHNSNLTLHCMDTSLEVLIENWRKYAENTSTGTTAEDMRAA